MRLHYGNLNLAQGYNLYFVTYSEDSYIGCLRIMQSNANGGIYSVTFELY